MNKIIYGTKMHFFSVKISFVIHVMFFTKNNIVFFLKEA